MSTYLIGNVKIIDGTGRGPFAGSVRVDGQRITAVTEGQGSPAPAGVTWIDGAGATLMPGLVESHAHIGLADLGSYDLTRVPPEEHMLITVRNARTMLEAGYTSAFSAAAPKPRLDIVLKREIEAGRVPGPRLLANGPEITVTGGLGDNNLAHLRTTRRLRSPGSPTGPTRSGAPAGSSPARVSTSSSSTCRATWARRATRRPRRP